MSCLLAAIVALALLPGVVLKVSVVLQFHSETVTETEAVDESVFVDAFALGAAEVEATISAVAF